MIARAPHFFSWLLGFGLLLQAVVVSRAAASGEFDEFIQPLLRTYCLDCHSAERSKGDLDLERFRSLAEVHRDPGVWQKVIEQIETGEMPPKEKPQPDADNKARTLKWIRGMLDDLGRSHAGDPGPVVLRRLSNAEYTYTIRDLTGVAAFDPAREFPVDGAAGEGFMNTGNSLVMSPALFEKYFDAGKKIASHAVLLPDGIKFSAHNTRRDWTDELVREIKEFYARFGDDEGAIPFEKYLGALDDPAAVTSAPPVLNARYLGALRRTFASPDLSFLLAQMNRNTGDPAKRAEHIKAWQKALWKFNKVGHMKQWVEANNPLTQSQEYRVKLSATNDTAETRLFLVAADAGDGNDDDVVLWQHSTITTENGRSIPLRAVNGIATEWLLARSNVISGTASILAAAARIANDPSVSIDTAAREQRAVPEQVSAWIDYLGVRAQAAPIAHFTNQLAKVGGHDSVSGWGTSDTPNLLANSSGEEVRVPGTLPPGSIAVHPAPKTRAAIGWACPETMLISVEGSVVQRHPECGNGVTWSLELRRGTTRQLLASGVAAGGKETAIAPRANLSLVAGDFVALSIGARDGNHACDLTGIDLKVRAENGREWNLRGLSSDILAANPRADRYGNPGVWHFFSEPEGPHGTIIPQGSLLSDWQFAVTPEAQNAAARALQELLVNESRGETNASNLLLYRNLMSLGGPFLKPFLNVQTAKFSGQWGIDPSKFGSSASKVPVDPNDLCVRAPASLEVRFPSELVQGCELRVTGRLHPSAGSGGVVQLQILTEPPAEHDGARAELPLIVGSEAARERVERAFDDFRKMFPAAIYYPRVVPVDEVITLTLFHREDDHLARLMLDDAEKAALDRLWRDLRFVSQDAFTTVDAFGQLLEYASQDSDPKLFEPLRGRIFFGAESLREDLRASEPRQIESLLAFATRAFRRPLENTEESHLKSLYARLCAEDMPHEDALRMTIARVLAAPEFLYRLEEAPSGAHAATVSNSELAARLSYFLWSSPPDDELSRAAAAGRLAETDVLLAQTRRMLRDPKVRRMAVEFGCQWLHVHGFDQFDEKSERHFPEFNAMRGHIYEETIQFFTDLFRENHSVLNILDADYTFLNEPLATFYDIPNVTGPGWRRVEGVRQHSRGGALGFAATLARQAGASRTSPILRGNWIMESLLGEKLPRPPKDVPVLPDEDNSAAGLSVRALVEKHSSDPKCAGCHQRLDPYGFALEHFDAIGRWRARDSGGTVIDAKTKLLNGPEVDGLSGLRRYLSEDRRDTFVRQFSRKLLGYALGRAVQLSDGPLLQEIESKLKEGGFRTGIVVESIVQSPQFRQIRGKDAVYEEPL